MATFSAAPAAARPAGWRSPLALLGLLAGLALAVAFYAYFTGDDRTFPVEPVAHLTPVPTALPPVRVGLAELPVSANGYLLTQTFDVAGPYVQPEAAAWQLVALGACLAYFLAAVSALPRPLFVAGMALVIFLLMSLNVDLLGIFDARQQYFLVLALAVLGLPAYGFHAFWPTVRLPWRLVLFAVLVGGLSTLLLTRSADSVPETVLHLSSYYTAGSAVALGLLTLWLCFENVHGLLWLNTQAATPAGRFGLWALLLASGLYLGLLLFYYLNNGEVVLLAGWRFDPLLVLLPAAVVGGLGLRRRAATFAAWVPAGPTAAYLYWTLVALAASGLGYALATANDPWLSAARDFVALAFLTGGLGFLLYLLFNFGPLIRQRLPVYRVVYQPRRLPFYTVYLFALGGIVAVETRNDFPVVDQVRAAYYNNLGDLTRLQSELRPDDATLAPLAERYYAESDVLDRYNRKASLGRAALYHFRAQRQNEINALRRALSRQPSEKVSVRLAALYAEPGDFFEQLTVLRAGLQAHPRSAFLAGNLAQLYTRTTLADSVTFYQQRAEAAAPSNPALQANYLAFLLQHQQGASAHEWVTSHLTSVAADPALHSNALLLAQLTGQPPAPELSTTATAANLTPATFARLYHLALQHVATRDTSLLPTLTQAAQRPANDTYAEQLTFLRALTQYHAGRPVAAQNTLLPLTTGTSAGAAYYQQLAGTWLLEQQLYATAAARLDGAAWLGATAANLPLAYAYALDGQIDSARTAARRAALVVDQTISGPATALFNVLTLDYARDYAGAPDSVKAQYLVVRGAALPPAGLVAAAAALTEPRAREAALLAQLPRALAAEQLSAVQTAIRRFAPAAAGRTETAAAWNVVRGQLALQTGNRAELRQLVQTAYFSPATRPSFLYYQAALAELGGQVATTKPAYARLVHEAPFLEAGVAAAGRFYTAQRDFTGAYQALQRGVVYNPESVGLQRAYALAAVRAGLAEYAAPALVKLRALLSPAEYATFQTEYAAQVAALAAWK